MSIEAAVNAGDDVEISSCSDVRIAGDVSAGDDVNVYAHADIEVASTIEAVDRIYLSAKDSLMLLSESWLGGINGEKARMVFLRAGDTVTLDGSINGEKIVVRKTGKR